MVSESAPVPRRLLMTTDAVGGVWQYTLELARGCAAAGTEVLLVTMGPAPSRRDVDDGTLPASVTLRLLDAPLDWMAEDAAAIAEAGTRLRRVAEEFGPDLVHLAGPCHAAPRWPVPVVATVHSCLFTWWAAMRDGPVPEGWQAYRDAMMAGLHAADRVAVPTAAFGRDLRHAYGDVGRLSVIRNGRDPAPYQSMEKQPVVLAAGRFWDEAKNLDCLDAAAARMPVPLLVAGPLHGPQGQTAVARHATWIGELGEPALRRRMAEASVFTALSRYEPFGLSVLEAAFSGCALVLSDIPTFRELWDGAAIFVDPDDADAVAEICRSLVADTVAQRRMAKSARRRAERYTAERMVSETMALYEATLSAGAESSSTPVGSAR